MASRKGNPVHGWVILDKPEGVSSARAVGIVRRIFQAAKAGHGGTLDPLATGILPIALGEATKTTSFAMQGSKSYAFTLSFGAQTQTDDREGAVIHESDVRPDRDAIAAVLPGLPAASRSARRSFLQSRLMVPVPMIWRAGRLPMVCPICQNWTPGRWSLTAFSLAR